MKVDLLSWSLPTVCPLGQCSVKLYPPEIRPGLGEGLVSLGQGLGSEGPSPPVWPEARHPLTCTPAALLDELQLLSPAAHPWRVARAPVTRSHV